MVAIFLQSKGYAVIFQNNALLTVTAKTAYYLEFMYSSAPKTQR